MINILDEKTINKIAAGEVIENPSNVVKELVENSIDAGAKNITIEIANAGFNYIKVIDDGVGIDKDEIKKALMEHATSKLVKLEDLYDIDSFGFRGEALPSIKSISRLVVISKKKNEQNAYKYVVEYGNEIEFGKAAGNDGTTIVVEKLFANVPVRKKFLKSIPRETANVFEFVYMFALSNVHIAFKLIIDGKEKLKTRGDGNINSIIYDYYGKDIYNNIVSLDDKENVDNKSIYSAINVSGVITKPQVARNNRNDEIYFVNKRYIKSKVISKAIEDAYSEFLMKHKFPLVILDINVDKSKVDVNVHPKKLEVRFADENVVYYSVYNAIYKKLKNIELIPNATLQQEVVDDIVDDENEIFAKKISVEKVGEDGSIGGDGSNTNDGIDKVATIEKNIEDLPTLQDEMISEKHSSYKENYSMKILNEIVSDNVVKENVVKKSVNIGNTTSFIQPTLTENHHYIGTIFDTYILVEFDGKLYIIDQHAAHEKINFEKLMRAFKDNEVMSQKVLPSIVLRLTPLKYEIVVANLDSFNKLGFMIEPFGDNDIKIEAVPFNLVNVNMKNYLQDIIDAFTESGLKDEYDSVIEKIASISCKKSVKANDKLSEIEVKSLLRELFKCDNPYNCPHGRPTIVSFTKYDFEKKFGRVVM